MFLILFRGRSVSRSNTRLEVQAPVARSFTYRKAIQSQVWIPILLVSQPRMIQELDIRCLMVVPLTR